METREIRCGVCGKVILNDEYIEDYGIEDEDFGEDEETICCIPCHDACYDEIITDGRLGRDISADEIVAVGRHVLKKIKEAKKLSV